MPGIVQHQMAGPLLVPLIFFSLHGACMRSYGEWESMHEIGLGQETKVLGPNPF